MQLRVVAAQSELSQRIRVGLTYDRYPVESHQQSSLGNLPGSGFRPFAVLVGWSIAQKDRELAVRSRSAGFIAGHIAPSVGLVLSCPL